MPDVSVDQVADHLNQLLRVDEVADYPGALNGVQVQHRGPVRAVACAVDAGLRSIRGARDAGANLLIVHHGLFWSGAQRLEGRFYERIALLITNDIALYSVHLPLDAHETHGNSRLLAEHIGLKPSGGFAPHGTAWCGVAGEDDIATAEIHQRLGVFAAKHGGSIVATPYDSGSARVRRWAVCSGSGANADTLREASREGIDTLIVGEGPHWTAVDAIDAGITVFYAGHYATETLGVQSISAEVARTFGIPWTFIAAPTGL